MAYKQLCERKCPDGRKVVIEVAYADESVIPINRNVFLFDRCIESNLLNRLLS